MEVLFFILMGVLLISLICTLFSKDGKFNSFSYELYKFTSIGFLFYCIIGLINWNTPTALDVYKGKTTLEITYRDDIPIDSVVVFKNKEEQQ